MAGRKQFPRARARKPIIKSALETSRTRVENLATVIDCSANHLLKVINGRVECPKPFADSIAKALGQRVEVLFEIIEKGADDRLEARRPSAPKDKQLELPARTVEQPSLPLGDAANDEPKGHAA